MTRSTHPLLCTLLFALLSVSGWAAGPAHAEGIRLLSASLTPEPDSEGAWGLLADFDVVLTPKVEEAVSRGVTLYFAIDFEVTRSRWYWWDEKAVSATQVWRLSYHALTRQYRLVLDGLQLRFTTLHDALQALATSRGWRVINKGALTPGQLYQAQLRMRLDTTLLPKPIQISAITNRDWNLSSGWQGFNFMVPKPPAPATPPAPDTLAPTEPERAGDVK